MILIKPGIVDGAVEAPSSKSMAIRAIAAAALAKGKSEISISTFSDDANAAIRCAMALGAKIGKKKGKLLVFGGEGKKNGKLDCGESGLCIRMFAPIAALTGGKTTLSASDSLKNRDVGIIEKPLIALGAKCSTNNGKPPVIVQGPLHGGSIEIDGSKSSQVLTGLLSALPLCKEDSFIRANSLKSKPYVKMTIELLKEFGVKVGADFENCTFAIKGGQNYTRANYKVEGDWSGAAFLLVAGAIAGKVQVRGLKPDSKQADIAIVDALKAAGAKVLIAGGKNEVAVEKKLLEAFEFDATDCPDLFPPLAALACNCRGKSRIIGAARLRGKESDRAAALLSEFGKMGAKISAAGDAMEITGGKLRGGAVDSHGDHRIAMACAVAALASEKGVEIKNEKCVSKSYPGFFGELKRLRVG